MPANAQLQAVDVDIDVYVHVDEDAGMLFHEACPRWHAAAARSEQGLRLYKGMPATAHLQAVDVDIDVYVVMKPDNRANV